jgi:predicted O-methyltransferase YrrM
MDVAIDNMFSDLCSRSDMIGRSGKLLSTYNGISKDEVDMVYETIANDPSVLKTLEVGCAIGFSSLAITTALKGRPNAHHTIIDPFQHSMFDSAGIDLLESKGINNFNLIERGSQIALPSLLDKSKVFDLILIDGFHSFEQTMLDIFYSTRLLREGGYLVVDDSSLARRRKVCCLLRKSTVAETARQAEAN